MEKALGEVCIKVRSSPASLPFKGQVTEQRTLNQTSVILGDPGAVSGGREKV